MSANLVLLFGVSIALFWGGLSRLKRGKIDMGVGYAIGLTYFSVLPLWILFLGENLPGIPMTTIPDISWSKDAEPVFKLILMLGILFPFLAAFPDSTKIRMVVDKLALIFRRRYRAAWKSGLKLRLWHLGMLYMLCALFLASITGVGTADAHWALSRHAFMESYGALGSVAIVLSAAFKYAFMISLFVSRPSTSYNFRFAVVVMVFAVIDLYSTGTRIALLQSLILFVVLKLKDKQYKGPILLGLCAIPIGYCMVLFTVVRSTMHNWEDKTIGGGFSAILDGVGNSKDHYNDLSPVSFASRLTEAGSINVFKAVEQTYPSERHYLMGSTMAKPFLFWIPRGIWPGKPINFASIMGEDLVKKGVSVNTTSMGEAYGNFGVLGVLVIPLILMVLSAFLIVIAGGKLEIAGSALVLVGFTITRNGVIETVMPLAIAVMIASFCIDNIRKSTSKSGAQKFLKIGHSRQ